MNGLLRLVTALLYVQSAVFVGSVEMLIDLMSLGPANHILTFHPNHKSRETAFLAIDGIIPDSAVTPSENQCPGTGDSIIKWIRIDLTRIYSVSRVMISSREYRGNGVTIHVGNNLTNSGLDNYICGDVWLYSSAKSPYFNGTLRTFMCNVPQLSQYVVVRGSSLTTDSLDICELQVFYVADAASSDDVSANLPSVTTTSSVTALNILLVTLLLLILFIRRWKK